jgi:hypothetical protein
MYRQAIGEQTVDLVKHRGYSLHVLPKEVGLGFGHLWQNNGPLTLLTVCLGSRWTVFDPDINRRSCRG